MQIDGKQIAKWIITGGAIATASIAIANALNLAEPHWVATRGFVRDKIVEVNDTFQKTEEQIKRRQIRTELQILQSRKESIKAKMEDRQLLLKQDGPPQYQNLIREQLDTFQENLNQTDNQIDDLRRELSGRRP